MKKKDYIVDVFDEEKIHGDIKLPIICVYDRPTDYPDKYIARLWDANTPTRIVAVADTLEELRRSKPASMLILPRSTEDDKVIVETWI